MSSKKELKTAYSLTIILLITGIICFTAFPAKAPEQPVRIMFKSLAGKIFFDHQKHASEKGYALSCGDCHHHPEGDESSNRACSDCHINSEEGAPAPKTCLECHESDDFEGVALTKKTDAFHGQCEDCHIKAEAGPSDKDKRCKWCHS
jgi:hypothetical protein